MVSLWGLLKVSKGLPPETYFERLWAARSGGGEVEYVGAVPFAIESKSRTASNYTIWGDIQQNDTPTPEAPVEVVGVGNKTDYGYEIPLVSRGKNLAVTKNRSIVSNGVTLTINNGVCSLTGTATNNGGRTSLTTSSPFLLKRGTYSFAADNYRNVFVSEALSESQLTPQNPSIFTITEDKKVVIGFNVIKGESYNSSEIRVQLELGSEATEYEPYRDPITTSICLPQPLYKDDYVYKDKSGGKVHREWGVKVFDGTEDWKLWSAGLSTTERFYYILSDTVAQSQLNRTFSSHFVYNNTNADSEHFRFSSVNIDGAVVLRSVVLFVKKDKTNNVDSLKTWFKQQYDVGTPVTIYYPLAEPTEETIDLPDLPLEIGYNMIDVDTEIKPEKMALTYKSSKAAAQADEALTNEILNLMEAI